ncbi:MAG: RidA family protein [Acetobacteraceae bacterium]|nr:RidA family protein [Acetobacteraceae bacterium]
MDILRISGGAPGRSRAVAFGDFAWAVATSPAREPDMAAQTRSALAVIEKALADAGSAKDRILTATIYITDMALWGDMNTVWNEWVPADAAPQRACVQTGLAAGCLVEITVLAARKG